MENLLFMTNGSSLCLFKRISLGIPRGNVIFLIPISFKQTETELLNVLLNVGVYLVVVGGRGSSQ